MSARGDGTSGRSRRRMPRPLQRFLEAEASGGILLLVAAVAALAWANVWPGSYEELWHLELPLQVGGWGITQDLRHWINDGAMTLFFLVVGLEIKRELLDGELTDRRAAALPGIAALGGMIVPALIYAAFNAGHPGSPGWGIPMATDIAFAVGVITVVGKRVPAGLRVFLLALAIVDDLGAIAVIAIFYTGSLALGPLFAGAVLLSAMALLRRTPVRAGPVYLLLGIGVWVAVYSSGIHATIAGVAIAFVTPARGRGGSRSAPPLVRLESALHPWTSHLIVPLFALANAGVQLRPDALSSGAATRVAVGVAAGLVAGKIAGIGLGVLVATRSGMARMPAGAGWVHVIGVSSLAGIGFTVSLFIADLAFADRSLLDAAKLGILAASVVAALAGVVLLRRAQAR